MSDTLNEARLIKMGLGMNIPLVKSDSPRSGVMEFDSLQHAYMFVQLCSCYGTEVKIELLNDIHTGNITYRIFTYDLKDSIGEIEKRFNDGKWHGNIIKKLKKVFDDD